jgi:uncharacterized protein YndB with AHSA1/START domain
MTDFTRSFTVFINAPVHTVFEYCRDPRRIFAGDPRVEVSDVTLTPAGVGTTAHIVGKGVVTEDVKNEYVEFVADQRIVFKSHPKVTLAGMTKEVTHGPTWTWTFAPEHGGTTLTVVFLEEDAAWWQRTFDVVTERSWSKQVRGWLDGIKEATEEEAAPAQ